MSRLADWWDDLSELERVNWVIALSLALTAVGNLTIRAVKELT